MTSDRDDDDGSEEIPIGRRLVRARSNVGLSLSERFAAHFYRLTWRTPLHALKLRGRYPLKLLAVPADPVSGDAARGAAIMAGTLSWNGEILPCDGISFTETALSASFTGYLHQFAWLRDLAAAAPRAQAAPIAEALTRTWLASNGEKVSEPAWRPDLWGWRILYWAAHAPLILSSTDLVYRSAVLNGLARGARHLDRTAESAAIGLPRLAAWAGVVAAGLLISGNNPRRSFGEAGLAKAMAASFTSDGGIICRTPRNQFDAVILLSMLREVYDARRIECPVSITAMLARAVPALQGVTLGDGALSSWQGSPPLARDKVDAVIAASGVRTRPLRQARDWGYQRLSAGHSVVVVDAAPPPIARVSGGGCASTLAFELSDGAHRLVVNCGGGNSGGKAVSAGLSEGLRTTAAHSTLILADSNSTAILSNATLGKGVGEVELDRQENEAGSRVEISHDGYVKRFGLIHQRILTLASDGRELRGEDILLPGNGRRKPALSIFAARFHLAPGVEATPTADGMGALLRIEGGALWQFRVRGAKLSIDDSIWIDGEGRPNPTQQLVASGEAPAGGASISWSLKRAG
ncbi:MAG: heparinase II/III family protein [Pseudomonadota bacterium]